jgi:outer membrane protein OmpA-like peptidoglycan-associated protein
MKKITLFGIAAMLSAVISCASTPSSAPAPAAKPEPQNVQSTSGMWVKASNDQLKKIPVEGFDYKSSNVPSQKWDTWAATAAPVIKGIVDKMPADYVLLIKGHTDARGPEQAEGKKPGNIKISADRAKNVLESLKKKGVSSDKITSKGVGSAETDSAYDSKDAKQRRVTFEVAPR